MNGRRKRAAQSGTAFIMQQLLHGQKLHDGTLANVRRFNAGKIAGDEAGEPAGILFRDGKIPCKRKDRFSI